MLIDLLAIITGASLTAYVLLGGADFGGGVWDLLVSGPRAPDQRRLIAEAIGPIWEANHVWLILVVVILFTGFPPAFARFSIALHLPLSGAIVGIVLRGSAFTFRAYDDSRAAVQRRWSRIFAISSLLTPFLLGTAVGTIVAGRLPAAITDGEFLTIFVAPWLAPMPLAIGAMTVLLFAHLAAIYLALAANDSDLADDFRRRAMASGYLLFAAGVVVLWLGFETNPLVAVALRRPVVLGVGAVGAVAAVATQVALRVGRIRVARLAAAALATAFIAGWGAAQWPWVIPPLLTLEAAAAPRATLELLLLALAAGAVVLFPSLAYLFRIFAKR